MNIARTNYYLLLGIMVIPVFLFIFGRQSEALYGGASLLILSAFLRVSHQIQKELRRNRDESVSLHLKRQTNIIMIFIVTGIVSAIYSILRFQIDSIILSQMVGALVWIIYLYGIWSLLVGFFGLPPRRKT